MAEREVEVGGVVGGEVVASGEGVDGVDVSHGGWLYGDGKEGKHLEKLRDFIEGDPTPAGCFQHPVQDFERPMRRNYDACAVLSTMKQAVGAGSRLIRKAPGKRCRSICNKGRRQYLWPSWMRSFNFSPPRVWCC